MSRQHLCLNHPDPDAEKWQDGPVAGCPHHKRNPNRRRAFIDKAAARAADNEAGVVGVDRGEMGYIHGT